MKFLQKIGKSLMLPVAVLPICGILMGIGYWMCPASMQGAEISGIIPTIGFVLVKAGGAIIDNMCWLFVIGVSVGMSDDNHGAACLSGLVSYLMIITLLSPGLIAVISPAVSENEIYSLAFSKIQNQFIAILAGLVGAFCYNKYKGVQLPKYLSFFSGRRFVVIASALYTIVLSVILAIIWPLFYYGLVTVGKWIMGLGGVGVGIYTFLNRLLIPFGLHHALNNVFWFDTIGIGDLTCFWKGMTSAEAGWSLGMYMSGFFPCMMFGIPGAALALCRYAKNRKHAVGVLLSSAVCAFVCGVTEPFEFAFMFAAFPLYIVYSILYGIFATITYYTGFRAGFSFSAGATDLLFSASLPAANATWQIIPLGIAAFIVFYLTFALILKRHDYPTPGNEPDDIVESDEGSETTQNAIESGNKSAGGKYEAMAAAILMALGGAGNIKSVDCCATRLRLEVEDTGIIDQPAIKKAGAIACKISGNNSCQIIIGLTVQQVCDALKDAIKSGNAGSASPIGIQEQTRIEKGEPIDFDATDHIERVITDKLGIHARPAGRLSDVAKRFESEITISADGRSASLKSITGIMSLGVTCGMKIMIDAKGTDEAEAITAIKKAIYDNGLSR